ncbi:MAG: carboxypeptidase-like regulatory domain-containing protein, partial [Pyrinomonadaceae bacterium]|nr:carboxypeptidase-like regulatory domain-containing protein [Sphingobacteriaceae bacterium]
PSYICDVYTKSVQRLTDAPKKILGQDVAQALNLDSNRHGILYQSETKSKFYYNYPHVKEIMEASKIAGDREGFSFNRALDLQVNLYDNLLQWAPLGNQSYVSPVADNAFEFYRYQLEGSTLQNGNTIYKIKIIPKSRFDPVFSGYIYLVEGSWRLYSVDLKITEEARINFVDTLKISQNYTEIAKDIWLPSDITFNFKGNVLGFKFAGYLTGLYSDYHINPSFPDNFFKDEIMKVPADVNKKDPAYWTQNRPIPLTVEEGLNYQIKDAAAEKIQSQDVLDSLQKERNKFKPLKFLFSGYTLHDYDSKSYWHFRALNKTVFYNTVEGWGVDLKPEFRKEFSLRRSIDIKPRFRYGFGRKSLNTNIEINYLRDTLHHESFSLNMGSDFLDLNNKGTINLFYNTLTTLFNGKNFLKLYKANFFAFSAQREIVDGLLITGGTEISRRFPLENSTTNKPVFDNAAKIFTSNNPLNPAGTENLFPVNNAFSIEAKLAYTYGQRYTTRPDGKIYENARYPTIKLGYRKGIPGIFNSAVNYDFISADLVQDKVKLGLLGYSSFYFSAGQFLNTKSLYYPDIKHFTGNQTAIYNPLFPNFHFLDYYAFATNDKYFEGHYEHNFLGTFLKRIPLIRKLKLEEIVGGALLSQPKNNYKEVYFGLQRLIVRADYGFSWAKGQKPYHAFRFFYGF